MRLVTIDDLVKSVTQRWRAQYFSTNGWYDDRKKLIYQNLLAAKDRAEINSCIGNTSWTTITCDECRSCDAEKGVVLGSIDDYCTLIVCIDCLEKAVKL